MLDLLAQGFSTIFTVTGLLCILGGVFIGIIFGSVPGLSATMALALFLPITYSMDSNFSIILLIALYIGGISGGLITAILSGIPGTPSSIATCFDGYPLTKKGQPLKALGVGITFSFLGTLFSTIVLIFLSPFLAKIAIKFGAYEYFAVALFSLSMLVGLSGDNIWKGLISGVMGCMFATVGIDAISSLERFTFGSQDIAYGFDVLPVLIGLFAITEIISKADSVKTERNNMTVITALEMAKGLGFSLKEFFGQIKNLILCSSIGTAIGILPGIGGGAANVMAYTVSKSTSKYPEKYGTGIIDGVVASESSNNAAIGGALVPLLALGIPGDTVTAILLGGLTLHGITPGPLMFTENVGIVYAIFSAMIVGSIVMFIMEFYGLKLFTKILDVPKHFLLPAIFIFCIIGAFGVRNNFFDVWATVLFGLVGFIFFKLKIPAAPFILGFIIGPLAELNLRRGLMFSKGDFLEFFRAPIASLFFVMTALVIIFAVRSRMKKSH
ncbi:tripartite tricarboxylate transporter permease [Gallibacterium anatis]|uniref:Tat pathway signal protein n=1 Tax=Gallibacterium anatis 4895 TaxID=1396510 RepID=A0A0A3A522_9PAST|nr:tripartite tricarboxylate transporter permease [Gallibacterium anatis]KGQ62837.1 Tat pathway signal protein [Gallibacterium anatis 4895]UZD15217.1 tripartite tricarboxylate transporter permease [Gallibacterium anatis]